MTEPGNVSDKVREASTQTRAAARSLADLARTLALAGIGAAALAKDETEALVSRMVERGTMAQEDARKMAENLAGRTRIRGERGQARMERRMASVLGRMNVPTRDDITSMNVRITALSAKVDALLATSGSTQTPPETGGRPEDPVL